MTTTTKRILAVLALLPALLLASLFTRPAATEAQAVRRLDATIDARSYGVAVSSANNTAALQAAVSAAGTSGRPCTVILPAGTLSFTGSTPVSVPSNVTLVGNGRGGTILQVQGGR